MERRCLVNSSLIGARLVENGVRFVNVTWDLDRDRIEDRLQTPGTPTRKISGSLKTTSFPASIRRSRRCSKIWKRGLLDETLIVVMSEMGRTPRVNGNAGRDHWTFCYFLPCSQGQESMAAAFTANPTRKPPMSRTIRRALADIYAPRSTASSESIPSSASPTAPAAPSRSAKAVVRSAKSWLTRSQRGGGVLDLAVYVLVVWISFVPQTNRVGRVPFHVLRRGSVQPGVSRCVLPTSWRD